jgi:hypothetical protein
LKLVIDAEQLPSAVVGQMLTELDKSFRAFVRRRSVSPFKVELAVGAVRAGSIEILLDAIDGLNKLNLARQYLAPFATHLAQVIELAVGMQLHKFNDQIVATDLKAIKSLATPVAKGHARQINIVNNGKIVLNIASAEAAKAILEGLFPPEVTSELLPAQDAGRLTISRQQVAELEQGKLRGSALRVDDAWYARLVGGQGVLVPISASESATTGLIHGRRYAFRGRPIYGGRGETVGITLDGATEIGNPVA